MASHENEEKAPEGAAEAPAKSRKGLLIGVMVGALVLGGGAGALVLGPRLAGKKAAPADKPAEAEAAAEPAGAGKIFKLENIIVNPSGTEGRRFLMASVAFEVPDDKVEKVLESKDIQIRDAVTAALESQTMEMLTRPGARDSLKVQLASVVGPMAGPGVRLRVYLPQFVIQ